MCRILQTQAVEEYTNPPKCGKISGNSIVLSSAGYDAWGDRTGKVLVTAAHIFSLQPTKKGKTHPQLETASQV